MIIGAHILFYSTNADADRAFLRDTFEFASVDAGSILYLMCDDVDAEIASLSRRGVACASVSQERWGRRTSFALPSGQRMGLYQPQHPLAIEASGK